jgi:hypothetical protein
VKPPEIAVEGVLPPYEAEADAIMAFYSRGDADNDRASLEVDVLCIHPSLDVLVYAQAVLKEAGNGVTTAANLADARVLLRATTPPGLVISSEWQSKLAALGGGDLVTLAAVVPWPAESSTEDPGEAAN